MEPQEKKNEELHGEVNPADNPPVDGPQAPNKELVDAASLETGQSSVTGPGHEPEGEMTAEQAARHDFEVDRGGMKDPAVEMQRISEEKFKKEIADYLKGVEEKVRGIRQSIDTHINSTPSLTPSREVSLCHTNLQRAKAFLGLTLGAIGTENPYPKSSDSSSPVIEKQAEHSDNILSFNGELDNVGKVKYMRSTIQLVFGEVEELLSEKRGLPSRAGFWSQESLVALAEAKMWLGWELDRIRKSENK